MIQKLTAPEYHEVWEQYNALEEKAKWACLNSMDFKVKTYLNRADNKRYSKLKRQLLVGDR